MKMKMKHLNRENLHLMLSHFKELKFKKQSLLMLNRQTNWINNRVLGILEKLVMKQADHQMH